MLDHIAIKELTEVKNSLSDSQIKKIDETHGYLPDTIKKYSKSKKIHHLVDEAVNKSDERYFNALDRKKSHFKKVTDWAKEYEEQGWRVYESSHTSDLPCVSKNAIDCEYLPGFLNCINISVFPQGQCRIEYTDGYRSHFLAKAESLAQAIEIAENAFRFGEGVHYVDLVSKAKTKACSK